MGAFEWRDDLLTGIDELDAQHRTLFARIKRLLDACTEGRGRHEVEGTLDYLKSYTLEHFALEERLMQEHRYSGIEAHLREHQEFLERVESLRSQLDEKGPGPYLVVITNRTISSWLTTHLRKTDAELAEFLRSRA